MDAAKLAELREALLKVAAETRAEDDAAAAERAPVELDQQSVGRLSRMDALQVQAMAQATSRRRAGELKRVAAALERMEAGEYGYCVECGEEIAMRRLELDPATPLCIQCASGR